MYSVTSVGKIIIHFDKPIADVDDGELVEAFKHVEEFEGKCEGKVAFSSPSRYGDCRLEVMCEGKSLLQRGEG